jgi:hypothetical protein
MNELIFRELRYDFDPRELREIARDLADELQRVYDLRGEKKTTVAGLEAAIKLAEETTASLQRKYRLGYEMREVECMALFHEPRDGMKRIARRDTGEVLEETAMSRDEIEAERQRRLAI